MRSREAHPARTTVLLPFAQLLPVFASAWAARSPQGFAPRFVTTQSWARQIGPVGPVGPVRGAVASDASAQDDNFRFDAGLDALTAHKLLTQAKVPGADMLAPMLVQACGELAGVAAAQSPDVRSSWAVGLAPLLSIGMEGASLSAEHAVVQLALAWAASTAYPTDALWLQNSGDTDLLVMVAGLQADPLGDSLVRAWGEGALRLDDLLTADVASPSTPVQMFPCTDFEDEAQLAAACVLRHWQAPQGDDLQTQSQISPVALVATDRVLTRRVRALLDASGVTVRDETGWKLSTTRAAASVVCALEACSWNASTDAVLDWLKNSPAANALQVRELERELRTTRSRRWQTRRLQKMSAGSESQSASQSPHSSADELASWVQTCLDPMQGKRSLHAWCTALGELLHSSGMHEPMALDAAGSAVLKALHLTPEALAQLGEWPQAQKRMALSEFTSWCRNSLEAASFVPDSPTAAQVVILPLSQLLGRSFAAVVMPGCDEVRFNASPDLPGLWLPSHRQALGLPMREDVEANLRAAWRQAAQSPNLQILWRRQGQEGEPIQLSPLVQQWLLVSGETRAGLGGPEPRVARAIDATPVAPPRPQGSALPVTMLSASAYADLRQCPYKFFALRQLRLQEPPELDVETEKRDFGDWLHEVLKTFHEEQLAQAWTEDQWPAQLDRIADACSAERKLGAAEFLPFAAAWPKLRDGYLRWWTGHLRKEGLQFSTAETKHEMGLGKITLHGRLDRVDRLGSAELGTEQIMVMDYKTESLARSKERTKSPLEDTQIAFYAALMPHDSLRAGYVNVGESDGTELVEQKDVVQARDALIHGILDDMEAIRNGAVLAAMGEGDGCDYCAARGLCRKDFWEVL